MNRLSYNADKQLPPPPPITKTANYHSTGEKAPLQPPSNSNLNSSSNGLKKNLNLNLINDNSGSERNDRVLKLNNRNGNSLGINISDNRISNGVRGHGNGGKTNVIIENNSTNVRNSLSSQNSLFRPKTLKRRNLKHLKIDDSIPQAVPLLNKQPNYFKVSDDNDNNNNNNIGGIRDPDLKNSSDELVSSMQNLELGVEYQLNIKAKDLLTLKKLGNGNSGTVSKVLHLATKKVMARKIIHIETKQMVQTQIIRELRIMHECDSPYIIGFYGSFINESDVVICMEYVDCGSLDKILKLVGPFPELILKQVAFSVLSGLIYLYDNHRIIHRDVKPSNVLMDSKGNMKLCDFGVSRELINSIADTFVGTSTYMSPERIQGGIYSIKGDVWSLGLMMVELATGRFPFGDNSISIQPEGILDLLQRIVNEKPPSLKPENGFSPELCDFIDLCLKKEEERHGPIELMGHIFLKNFNNNNSNNNNNNNNDQDQAKIKNWARNVRRIQKGKDVK